MLQQGAYFAVGRRFRFVYFQPKMYDLLGWDYTSKDEVLITVMTDNEMCFNQSKCESRYCVVITVDVQNAFGY